MVIGDHLKKTGWAQAH